MKRAEQAFHWAAHGALLGTLGFGMAMAPLGAAASDQTTLKVSATILKRASLQVLAQPSTVVITADDIARGYIDVSQVEVAISNNSLQGYMLVFDCHAEFVRQTRVRGLDREVQLGADGGAVVQTANGQGVTNMVLDLVFRFELAASARQGVYPWPMELSVTPL
jgi:hypothetical protein